MDRFYTDEINALIVMSLLKEHGIRRVVASPGTTNMALVASMQQDPFFLMHSCVDERSAAYIACGMSAESGEPVVISCTGATAARNYFPGMTEAYYRKLPLLVITSTQAMSKVGHHVAQVIDNSQIPRDAAQLSLTLPIVKDEDDRWDCEVKVNQAILQLLRHGGGPVHLNLQTVYSRNYNTKTLPTYRKILRYTIGDELPRLPIGNIGILVGSHKRWDPQLLAAVDRFCSQTGAAVLCDHTSGYTGRHKVLTALLAGQKGIDIAKFCPDLLISIGEVTGDYFSMAMVRNRLWRVSPDGAIRDAYRRLDSIFEMPEAAFFAHYADHPTDTPTSYRQDCQSALEDIQSQAPDVPFSNIWTASILARKLPANSTVHFGILNSLRAWNFFDLPPGVESSCNVGGFGIDGGLSTAIGASLCNPNKLFFCVIGDLAFFYDLNSLGNRHISSNLRVLLINNGKGTEFSLYGHIAEPLGEHVNKFISAAGHFGKQSPALVKHYAEDLGFEYLSASNKNEFIATHDRFVQPATTDKPMLFEVFTNSDDESRALELMQNISTDLTVTATSALKGLAKAILGQKGVDALRKLR